MNERKCKKLFYKESAKWLKRGWTDGYISPNTIKYGKKVRKTPKVKTYILLTQ